MTKQVGGSHYKRGAIQPIDFILANDIPFPEGSVIKYVFRWKDKGGIEDLKKAIHYLEFLIEHEQKRQETKEPQFSCEEPCFGLVSTKDCPLCKGVR